MNESDSGRRERFERLQQLFHELEPLRPRARSERLEDVRRESESLYGELLDLLEPDGGDETLVQREMAIDGIVDGLRQSVGDPASADEIREIGPYRLLRLLGEGGMGRVWEAEQTEPLVRRVALKLLRPRVQSADVLARFRAERQALAVLDHGHIAKVLDAGETADGQPWFAMELVDGVPITDWADREDLDLEQRIELVIPICDAIHHAHLKGVIHRDLKPSNILVARGDEGQPVPKVIDFGIAKAIEQPVLARTLATQFGQLVGTPEYMSPEQATLGAVDVDARSDVYSLGLVLYELLVGQLPITIEELRGLAFDEVCRRIREADTPRPSTRLLTTSTGDVDASSAPLSTARSAVGSWSRRVRTDLDAVLLKSLAKDRDRRYESAAAFGRDLERFLREEPVEAAVPTWTYRATRFVRRNRLLVALSSTAVLGLVGGLVAATIGLFEARSARAAAVDAREEALSALRTSEETSRFVIGLFRASDPRNNPGIDLTASELLARGAERIDRLEDEPQVQARLLETLGDANWSLGDYSEAERLLLRAVELRRREAPDPMREAEALNVLGGLYRDRAQWDQAEQTHRDVIELLDGSGNGETKLMGSALNSLGIVLRRQQRFDEAAEVLQRTLELTERLEPRPSQNVAVLMVNLAALRSQQGELEVALELLREALSDFEQILPEAHPHFAGLLNNRSIIERRLGRLGEARQSARQALELDRRVLSEDHPTLARGLHTLGAIEVRLGNLEAARAAFLEGIQIVRSQFGEENFEGLIHREGLALLDLHAGHYLEAAESLERARSVVGSSEEGVAGRSGAVLARYHAAALRYLGRFDAAERVIDEALEDVGEGSTERAMLLLHRALVQWQSASGEGERAAARATFIRASKEVDCDDDVEEPCRLDQPATSNTRAQWYAVTGQDELALRALELEIADDNWSALALDRPEFEALAGRSPEQFARLRTRLRERLAQQSVTAPR